MECDLKIDNLGNHWQYLTQISKLKFSVKKGKFMFIVNHPEGADEYIQLVRLATWVSAGEECGQGRLASSVSTQCNQEYLDHKLVALSDTGEELVVDTFSFPSCCTCLMNTGLEL